MKVDKLRIKSWFIKSGFVLIFLNGCLLAQNNEEARRRPKNNITLNILGDASIFSANYERLYFFNQNIFVTGKIGAGFIVDLFPCLFRNCPPPDKYLTLTHHITGNFGKRKEFLEIGLGGTFISGDFDVDYILYPILGLRYQPLKSGKTVFRLFTYFPIIEGDVSIFFGFCLGGSF